MTNTNKTGRGICARPYLEVRHRMADDGGNHLAGLERDDSSNWMAAAARTGTGAGRGRWRGGRHLSFGCRPLDCHRSVATVRWRNCHHSSVYGQSASRKMVNKWMPNWFFWFSKRIENLLHDKKKTFFTGNLLFPARDSSRCSFKFKWVRTCLLSSQKKTVGSSLTSAKQNNYFPPNQPKRTFSFPHSKEMRQSATLEEEVVGMMMNEPSVWMAGTELHSWPYFYSFSKSCTREMREKKKGTNLFFFFSLKNVKHTNHQPK